MRWLPPALALLALTGCWDGPSRPGSLRASLLSPNGPEGAAAVTLFGEGITDVVAAGDAEVHWLTDGDLTQVVLIHPTGGALEFEVVLLDVGGPLVATVREVAAPDDQLRSSLVGYRVELGR